MASLVPTADPMVNDLEREGIIAEASERIAAALATAMNTVDAIADECELLTGVRLAPRRRSLRECTWPELARLIREAHEAVEGAMLLAPHMQDHPARTVGAALKTAPADVAAQAVAHLQGSGLFASEDTQRTPE